MSSMSWSRRSWKVSKTLQLGCGVRPLAGAINHDRVAHAPHVDVDVAHDLDQLPWPWEDGQFSKIVALDVMEHLSLEIHAWLAELWRILEVGGTIELRLP